MYIFKINPGIMICDLEEPLVIFKAPVGYLYLLRAVEPYKLIYKLLSIGTIKKNTVPLNLLY